MRPGVGKLDIRTNTTNTTTNAKDLHQMLGQGLSSSPYLTAKKNEEEEEETMAFEVQRNTNQ